MRRHLLTWAAISIPVYLLAGSPLAAQPAISAVLSNYSYTLPNLPNYGIAPGSLFIIFGTGMAQPGSQASPLQDPSKALPQTLNGASVSVTVNGVISQSALYYATPTQIAAVLPSSTPLGTLAEVKVTFGGATSQQFNTTVAQSAFGFDTYYGTGSGMAAVTDNFTGRLITPASSAQPGETIVFWGSGVGADTNNNDVDPPAHFDNLNFITQLFIGGVSVPIGYQGRSHYQGVDQVDVTLPANVPTGCAVSVVAVGGSGNSAMVSNTVTMPVSAGGGGCIDPLQPVSSTEAAALAGHALVNLGSLSLSQITNTTGTSRMAGAQFVSIPGASLFPYLGNTLPSLGSCVVYQQVSVPPVNPYQLEGLNPGTISVTGAGGTQALSALPSTPGLYTAALTAGFLPPSAASYTFAGLGGPGVQAFSTPVDFPNPLDWTNSSAAGAITRAEGLTVNWTGGDASTYVQISGSASTVGASVFFICDAPLSPATFTVPPSVLLALPAAGGGVQVSSFTNPKSFSAAGLDFGYAASYVSTFVSTTYQ
jgi:uncharacterized protein (TIGR03437 family)